MKSLLLLILSCLSVAGHVGVNDVFFEGLAGPYPLYITVRPPIVIPGIAEISIRSAARDVKSIQIAPMTLTGPGSKYPPTPDQAIQSSQDPQTFTGALWIMSAGSWQVRATVAGERGQGVISVPVRAASQKVTNMDTVTGAVLIALTLLLAAGLVGIAGAALREAVLPPGAMPDNNRLRRGRLAMASGLVLSAALIYFGNKWWVSESRAYARSIYRPIQMLSTVQGRHLHLQLSNSGAMQPRSIDDLVADHGHLMHLYAIREPNLDAAFHVHPIRQSPGNFLAQLPAMPAGKYRLFADIVHESGFPETLIGNIELISASPGPSQSPDDAGSILTSRGGLADGGKVIFESSPAQAGIPLTLRFRVEDPDGNPAANLRPYLGMNAHLAIVKKDLSVFSHVHPQGNISMAALEMTQTNNSTFPNNVLVSSHVQEATPRSVPAEFSFPFGFPTTGNYLLILQFARKDKVETASFDMIVQ